MIIFFRLHFQYKRGQTKRKLNTRISEHRNQINRKSTNTTGILEHRLRYNHDFD